MSQHPADRLLLLIHPPSHSPTWLDTWARSYPHSLQTALPTDPTQHPQLNRILEPFPHDQALFVLVHQNPTFLHWYYHADWRNRRRITGIILHQAPLDDAHSEIWQRIRFDCPTALILPQHSPEAEQLAQTSGARLIIPPAPPKGNWQWGMKLMQEMVMAQDKAT